MLLSSPDRRSLFANIAAAVLATLLINGLIFGTGLATNNPASDSVSFAPPGWVIGCIWVGLFALFGAARWRLVTCQAHNEAAWLTALMAWCLAYPFTSAGFDPAYGQLANCVSLLFAAFVAHRAWRADQRAGLLLLPSLLWMSFAVVLGIAILHAA